MIDTQAIRSKLLDLAMCGQLTEQLQDDGTADDLYRLILAKRQSLIKSGGMKKDTFVSEVDDIPYEIPTTWKWVRLGSIARVLGGKRIPAGRSLTEEDTGHIYIRVSDMKNRTVQIDGLMFVPKDIYPSISQYIINKEDIYITVAGTIGRVGKIPPEIDGANLTENADRIVFAHLDQDWLILCLSASMIQKQIELLTTQVAQPKLAIKRIQEFLIPLPPLAEQHRIVEQIEQAFSVLDTIDTLQTQYADNLAVLKSKLIDLAIQGKLTEQLPEDGTAEELYQQIQAEKQALIKDGKIKKEKPLPEIADDEVPLDIPASWKWIRWGDIVNIVSARRVHQSDWRESGVPFYRAREIARLAEDGFVKNDLYISEELYAEFSKTGVPHADDLMVSAVGTLGRTYVVKEGERFYYKDASVLCFVNFGKINPHFLAYTMKSNMMRQQIESNSGGTTVDTLTMIRMIKYLLPLPPLAEQKRIVERLDQILAVCDELK